MRRVVIAALCLTLSGCLWHRGGAKPKKETEIKIPSNVSEPDRVLYEQALKDLKKSRFNIARLTLQTLINTYPDSEFLPEAKYALAESFYREGTTSNLNQAESEFKDFITFFPTSDRADDAQLMIAMTHIRQMEKPDRDPTQSVFAETELRRMIETYPDSPLLDEAKEKLRAVQEVLAEGVFKIGSQYFIRKSYPAAISRFHDVLDKYPDYSRTPDVLFELAEALQAMDSPESATYYAKIASDYPYSTRVAPAKTHLTEMNKPIPEPNAAALARGETAKSSEDDKGLLGKLFGTFGHPSPVSTETGASSISKSSAQKSDSKDSGGDAGSSLKIENKPTKKPR